MYRLAALLALAPVVPAQVSATTPSIFKHSFASGSNALPAGRTKAFLQTWYAGKNLPIGMVATQIGWRYDTGANGTAFTHTMEVVLDNTPATFGTLSRTFAANLSATPVTFLPATQINWPAPTPSLDPAIWIPGTVPFPFTGPNLLVQVDVQTEATPRSIGLVADGYLMSTTTPHLAARGPAGCAGSQLDVTNTVIGPDVQVRFALSGGPASSQAVFMLGVDNQAFAGVNLLPLDLGFAGMTGCTLGVDPLVFLTLPTDPAGGASLQGLIPTLPNDAQMLFAQAVHAGGTPAGLVSTNVVGAEIGAAGLSNYVYNWTTFTTTAQYGPYTTNRGAVLLLR